MFFRRRWARLGGVLQRYIRIVSVVLLAIFVLFFTSWGKKPSGVFLRETAELNQKIQERFKRGKKKQSMSFLNLESHP